MIPFVNGAAGLPNSRLLASSFNTTIERSANTWESISCTSSTVSTEILTIPAGSLVAPGDYISLEILGTTLNNTGSNKRPNVRLTLDSTLICSTGLGMVIATATNPKPWLYEARITLSGAATANVRALQSQGNAQGAGSLPQGTVYGDLAVWVGGVMWVRGVAFNPAVAHTLIAEAQWDAGADASLLKLTPMERTMTVTRF